MRYHAKCALIAFAGVALIALGAGLGQYRDVLAKAILICMECIGIG